MLEIRMLGQFDVRHDGEPIEIPTRGAQSLLALLALNKGISHRRERLAGLLWPESTDENARAYLRHALWRLRRSLDETPPASGAYLSVDDLEIGFKPEADHWLDTDEIRQSTDASRSIRALETRVGHYQGELLPGFYDAWAVLEREHLNVAFEQRMKQLLKLLATESRWEQMIAQAERWIAFGRVPEAAYQALMVAHAGLGDAAAMRASYRRLTESLERELGLQPSADVEATFRSLKEGLEVAPQAWPVRLIAAPDKELPPAAGDPPYLGLSYFDLRDSGRFFGRDRLTANLVAKLADHPFLGVVVGASGCGKSSLVRAGLVPALQAGEPLEGGGQPPEGSAGWSYHVLTPTAYPLESLAASLTRSARTVVEAATLMDDMAQEPGSLRLYLRKQAAESNRGRAFILVDQFEELFTQCQDERERRAFIDNLMAAAKPEGGATVVIVLRADFYGYCSDYPELRQALADHQAYIGAMNARELRMAIEGPAKAGNWDLQPGLVDLMLRDVRGEPGYLPLLSHALLETWRRRSGRTLTLTGYAQAGGVRRAIARTAESVYNQLLDDDQRAIAKDVFLRLTGVGQGMADTRRRATFDELVHDVNGDAAINEVLTVLGDSRLITLDRDSVELAHEALIREWPRLRRWLDEDREGLELHRHLTETALEWERLDRDTGELYRGLRLTAALEWQAGDERALNLLEQEFLQESETQAAAERAARARQTRRLQLLAGGLAVVLVLALGAAAIALRQADRARAQARLANQRAVLAAAINDLSLDPERSMLLALYAMGNLEEGDASILQAGEAILRRGLETSRAISTFPGEQLVILHPEGRWLVTATDNRTLMVVEPMTGEAIRSFQPHDGEWVTAAAVSRDGAQLATADFAGELRVWDTESWQQIWSAHAHRFAVQSLAFSPNGRWLASGGSERIVKLWDSAAGAEVAAVEAQRSRVTALAFSPNSSLLVSAGADQVAHIWRVPSAEHVATLEGHTGVLNAVAVSADCARIATVSDDDTIRLWDGATGSQKVVIRRAHAGRATDLAFLPMQETLVTVGADGNAKIWDARTGDELRTLQVQEGEVVDLTMTRDGAMVATAPAEGSARVWRLQEFGDGAWARLPGHVGSVRTLEFNPNGELLASGGTDGRVLIWDTNSATLSQTLLLSAGAINDVQFRPNAAELAVAVHNGSIGFWDPASGQKIGAIQSENTEFLDLAFTVDGGYLNALGIPYAFIYDLQTGEVVERFSNGGNTDGEYSRDGRLFAWTDRFGQIGTVLLTGPTDYEILPRLAGLGVDIYGASFSPNSQRIVAASEDGVVRIWDTDPGLTAIEFTESDREQLRLVGHRGPVLDSIFSPDGQRIATLGQDGTIRLWDAQTGSELFALTAFAADIAFSPDGRFLAAANDNGSVSLFLFQLSELVDQVKARLTRGLSDAECRRYLATSPCPPLP